MRLRNFLRIGLVTIIFLTLPITPVFASVVWTSPTPGSSYESGTIVTATVKSTATGVQSVVFTWKRGDGSTARTATYAASKNVDVSDTCTTDSVHPPPSTWTIYVDFYDQPGGSGNVLDSSSRTFTVTAPAPEFPFGVPIILLFACLIYIIARRRLK